MAYRIIVSHLFDKSTASTITWLRKKWSQQVAESFVEKLTAVIDEIMINPERGKIAKKEKNVRSVIVTKYNRLYYQIEEDVIILLELFETKMNPGKNRYE